MANNSPKFPCTIYGVIVYNVAEGREVCKRHEEELRVARATQASARIEEESERYMRSGYSLSEARFLAMGGVPCSSVSAFV